jgi:hypothetical protein
MNPGEATTPNVPGSITDPPFLVDGIPRLIG